jgi:hypothetical protein
MLAFSRAERFGTPNSPRVRRTLAAVFALACGALLAQPLTDAGMGAPSAGKPSWQRIDGAPVDLRSSSVASVWTGRRLLVLGQPWGGGQAVAASYDPRARAWRALTPPSSTDPYPSSRATWTGRRVVVMNALSSLVYDPGRDRWARLARGHGGLVAWTGRELVAWGGGCCGDALRDGVAYDPESGRWRTLAQGPLAGSQGPVGAWTGRELLVFVGDRTPDGDTPWPARLARAAAYDPATNRWRRIARMPEERPGASVAWDGRELLVVGGRAGRARGPLRADGFAFDPASNRWRRLAAMPAGREGSATVCVDKSAVQSRIAKPTVRVRMTYDDFAELVSRRAPPYALVARGRMRLRGDPRILLKLQRLFA